MASWCSSVACQRHTSSSYRETSYPAHDLCAALTLAHHISCAITNLPARQVPRRLSTSRPFTEPRLQLRIGVILFVAAVQRVLDELAAVLEQIGAELSACTRQIVKCVQVELAGKLSDYAVWLSWLACRHGAELVLGVGSGSRITAEGCRESVDVGVRPLVCCFRMFVLCRGQQVAQQRLYVRNAGC